MVRFDRDQFEERSAIAEYDGGLSRFDAETLAAREQGFERWEVMNGAAGSLPQGGNRRASIQRHATHAMSAMQSHTNQAA